MSRSIILAQDISSVGEPLEHRTLDDSSGCHSMPMHTPSCALKLRKIFVVFQSQKKAFPSPSPEMTYRPSVEKFTWDQAQLHVIVSRKVSVLSGSNHISQAMGTGTQRWVHGAN